ncbi:acyl-CoA dehydrogenase family protein [Streptomyces sp. ISL-11]|uniref:acyl-CoA dehydrogenase family protein n=1 Tax=Streptomyces sp. ISL-11 TaxID=2819174 RepID=UPI001BE63C80|nr:acyl-CoA dehydrogenase family protein [Streptomyces sp. ISL-11]MBT2387186.1 acyl-CoA dehydrogenase family protein [Streptomyces sp. ISL-11]
MDFRPTDDQRALQAGMRDLLAARFPRERLRALVDGGPEAAEGPGRELWRELGHAGLFALRLPEEHGGVGLGLPEAVLLFEEAGCALLPGPLVATHLAAGLLPGAADGARIVTAVDRPGPVEHLVSADAVLLLDGATARLVETGPGKAPGVLGASPLRSVDPATPLHHVGRLPASLVPVAPDAATGDIDGTTGFVDVTTDAADVTTDTVRLRHEAALLTAAQQLGSARRTVEMAVTHARHRTQFGRPIGAFQSVQHLCADMHIRLEIARVSVYAASLTADPADIAGAKLLADSAAVGNARDCLQVHGGLGFTWAADVHLHLKRAWIRTGQWLGAAEAEEFLANNLLMSGESEVPPDVLDEGRMEKMSRRNRHG